MNVYVESNFVVVIALAQERFENSERILSLSEAERVSLARTSASIRTLARRAVPTRIPLASTGTSRGIESFSGAGITTAPRRSHWNVQPRSIQAHFSAYSMK